MDLPSKSNKLVIPANIPWDLLKGKDLEECVFWLLESMGAKRLDWRLGGTGGGASDGGRDLECIFHVPDPSGEIVSQRWWVEAKGRKGSVSPTDIKESIITAQAKPQIDVHIIVTNQQFSNPTKDWVGEWQIKHPRPTIRLWEKHDLERYMSRHPEVAVRLFSNALTTQGILNVVSSRFWDHVIYPDVPTLIKIWDARNDLEWTTQDWFAVLVGECANGSLAARPWSVIMPFEEVLMCFLNGLSNILNLSYRTQMAGIRSTPIQDALAHLLIHLIARLEPKIVASFIERFRDLDERMAGWPDSAINIMNDSFFQPIINRAIGAAGDACSKDCSRVSVTNDDTKSKVTINFWDQFRMSGSNIAEVEEKKFLYFIGLEEPCRLNLGGIKTFCPFVEHDMDSKNLTGLFELIKPALMIRTGLAPFSDNNFI